MGKTAEADKMSTGRRFRSPACAKPELRFGEGRLASAAHELR